MEWPRCATRSSARPASTSRSSASAAWASADPDASGDRWPWAIGEEASREIFRAALDAGVNFFDTANVYSGGTSEEILGRALRELGADRDEIVIATKLFMPMREGPNGGGLSRKAIMTEIDDSLRRLGTDYVDLYQIHRWDYATPIEETLEALHDVVKAGKARYIGASSMFAWQFAKALHVAERHGWTRFVSMQDHYNLLYREEEREMLPLCADEGDRRDPLEPAGARPADPALGRGDRAHRDRRVRPHPLPRRGPGDRRAGARGRRAARPQAGAGGARLAARQGGGHRADRRRDQGPST